MKTALLTVLAAAALASPALAQDGHAAHAPAAAPPTTDITTPISSRAASMFVWTDRNSRAATLS